VFDVVLVAGRGATATRVVRTCHRLGASVVAAHSDGDAAAAAVRLADEAVPLGGRSWDESYGDPRKLVEAARRSGADAVHPGAGRLAGDAAAARAVEDAGLAWLGLPAAVLGRDDVLPAAAAAGLRPALPSEPVQALLAVTLTPSAAAVRQVWVADDNPVLERVPAAVLTADQAASAGAAARAFADAVHAGPVCGVALVVDAEGGLRFVALTPAASAGAGAAGAVLGVDVVEAQLRLASGGRLRPSRPGVPAALSLSVCALERYAGRLRRWRMPQVEGVSVDAGVAEGDHVTADADRLLAVLTATGDDAGQAEQRAATALSDLEVAGVPTTLPLLRAALASPGPVSSPVLALPLPERSRSA
jgi:acetyl/propionyl-CoA carboxylase alpha subunit